MPSDLETLRTGLVGELRRTVAGARFTIDHSHATVEFDLVVHGTGTFVLGERSYDLRPGTLVWVVPGQHHRLDRSPHFQMWVAILRPDVIDEASMAALAAHPLRQIPGDELLELDRLLAQVAQDSDEPAVYNAGMAYAAQRALRASLHSPAAASRELNPAVTRALLLLRKRKADLSLSALANAVGISATYLSRLLVENTGRSFVDWRNRIRLDRFVDAYRPSANLLAAAMDAGFGSYARFHRVFVEVMGCTPSEWAASSGSAEAAPTGRGLLPKDFGLPPTGTLSHRQAWIRVVPLVAPAVRELFGPHGLDDVASESAVPPRTGRDTAPQDAALTADARERLLASLRPQSAGEVDTLARLLARHDIAATCNEVFEAYGLAPSRMPDAAAAWIAVMLVAATGDTDPEPATIAALQSQVDRALTARLAIVAPQVTQEAHRALLVHFATAYRALQAARASGDPRMLAQLRSATEAGAMRAFGVRLDQFQLTPRGLARREHAPRGPGALTTPPPRSPATP